MMVLWWAVFFVLGIILPSVPISAPICTVFTVLTGWGGVLCRRRTRLFVIYASTSLLIWTGAGLARSERGATVRGQQGPSVQELSAVRAKLVDSLEGGRLSERSSALLAALLLAERTRLGDEVRESYAYLGIAHFLALSGLHLGAIMIPLAWIAGLLPVGRGVREGCMLSAIVIYSAVTDFPPSLVRAAALALAFMIQRRCGKKTTLVRSLALGVFALVLLDFEIVFDGGFQLSCAAVCAIALVAIPLMDIVGPRLPGGWAGRALRMALAPVLLTVSINAFTLPLVLLFFKRAPLLAPLFNLAAVLAVTAMLYLGLAYFALPVRAVRMMLAFPIDNLAELLWEMPLRLSDGHQPALYAGDVAWIPYGAGLFLLVCAVRRNCPRRLAILSIAAGLIAASVMEPSLAREEAVRRRFALQPAVERMTRRCVLLDCGDRILLLDDDIGRREAVRLTRGLWGRGIHRLERLVICPSRLRKTSGVYHLLARLEIGAVTCNPYLVSLDEHFCAAVSGRGMPLTSVSRDDSMRAGAGILLLLAPAYPPPGGGGVSAEEAKVGYEVLYEARENAN